MAMPNFLVVGAMKAGTTTIYRYLGQHPDIFMSPVKEPQFFSGRSRSGWRGPDAGTGASLDLAGYQALFAGARSERARGEATPVYLCDPIAVEKVRNRIPDARLIAILRQPVDRAYSAFLMKRRQGWERLGFEDALAAEPRRIEEGWRYSWHYAALGRYREQLERCYRCFSPAQIKVVLYDDLVSDPRRLMRELFRFLEVDEAFEPDMSGPPNAAFAARSPAIQRWITTPSRMRESAKRFTPAMAHPLWRRFSQVSQALNSTAPPPLAPALRARLTREWDDEIRGLQELIGRDLSAWFER